MGKLVSKLKSTINSVAKEISKQKLFFLLIILIISAFYLVNALAINSATSTLSATKGTDTYLIHFDSRRER